MALPVRMHWAILWVFCEVVTMKYLVAACVLLTTLTGCAVYTPHGAVVVDPHGDVGRPDYRHDDDRRFCPPGQAKKGNC